MRAVGLACFAALFCACGQVDPGSILPQVHRVGMVQGNIITQQMVDQIKPGMTKEQVLFVMGTPLVQDTFASGVWHYYYRFEDDRRNAVVRRVDLHFSDQLLAEIRGDLQPQPTEDDDGPSDN